MKRERIRNTPLKKKRIAAVALLLRNDEEWEKRIAALALLARNDRATAYCKYLTAFVATKWCVILSAKRERIRLPFKRKTDCRAPYGGLACRLGRCFCFAEVSAGHPHRNDKSYVILSA